MTSWDRQYPRLLPLLLAGVLVGFGRASAADHVFKIGSWGTSPDGRYTIGYGFNGPPQVPLNTLREVPKDDAEFDRRLYKEDEEGGGEPVNLRNYLVDVRMHQAVAVLPGFTDFPTKNHYASEFGWSWDGKTALAIYRARYADAAVAWIDTRTGRVSALGDELEKTFRKVLTLREGKAYTRRPGDYAVSLFDPMVTSSGEVIVGWAEANNPKKDAVDAPDFSYALKFHLIKRHGKLRFILVRAVRDGDFSYDQPLDNEREAMIGAYQQLRRRLHGDARAALEREQRLWQRSMDESGGNSFQVAWRARALQLQLRFL